MKAIGRFILATLIVTLFFAVFVGIGWLLGTVAHAIKFLPYMLDGDTFDLIVLDGLLVLCMIGAVLCVVGLILNLAQALK